ncbi:MAG TPA: hypothetical protein VFA33_18740 [Bryobacteraceae bacterium]|nr:hypothetical protein [Bryobacteraceae bacterium]
MPHQPFGRRAFLGVAGAGAASAAARTDALLLPLVSLGAKRVSRLIAGANPVNGYSHCTQRLSELMVQYFTVERTTGFLLHCERQGINTWQSSYSPKVRDALRAAREQGSKIQFICLTSGSHKESLEDVLALDPIAIVHHGGVTDRLFQAGTPELVRDYVKRVQDRGIPVGISTHNPDFLARIEDSGWENQFYMTCVYNVTRTRDQLQQMLGDQPLGELFLAGDPERMLRRVRQVAKPCLAFKILGAGRLCDNAAKVEQAFAFAYRNIKPIDGVIVGLYPVLFDEVKQDTDLARKYA